MKRSHQAAGFTFVEAIFTIAIIGIMATLALSAISNLSQDANRVVARQQQAVVQEALSAWVMSQTRVANSAQIQGLNSIRLAYNALGTTSARFNLLEPNNGAADIDARAGFLDQATVDDFHAYTTAADRLKTAAMDATKQYLILPTWEEGAFPRPELVND